jgi:transcriptional regulator with XRE-family HTH domain
MTPGQLKAGRLDAGLTQMQAARRLGVSQPYLSQLEQGERPVTAALARSAAALYQLPATALPMPDSATARVPADQGTLARQLAGLGYPGLAHPRGRRANPAAVLLAALVQRDLELRLAQALAWVVLTYPDLDWSWLVRGVKLRDAQNRLGVVLSMARERARLAAEDTLCRDSTPAAERDRLAATRSPLARHWNLLSGLTPDRLTYAT